MHEALRYSWHGFVASLSGGADVEDDRDLIAPQEVLDRVHEIVQAAGCRADAPRGHDPLPRKGP